MIGESCECDEYVSGSYHRQRLRRRALDEYRERGRRQGSGRMAANAKRAVHGCPLIAPSCVVPDHADISAIGANDVSGSQSQRRQRRRMQHARKNDIQNKRVGGKPCHPDANHPFARCVLHRRFPKRNYQHGVKSQRTRLRRHEDRWREVQSGREILARMQGPEAGPCKVIVSASELNARSPYA